jgi:hypothetical protein
VKAPPVPVFTVATSCTLDEPSGRDVIETDSLTSPVEIFPLRVVDPPYVSTAASAASVTSGGGRPFTLTQPFSAGCRESRYA